MDKIYKINALKNCVDCNICCSSPFGSPFLFEEEVKKIRLYVQKKGLDDKFIQVEKHFEISKNEKGDCGYLNNKGLCDIYDVRPLDCRIFPVGFTQKGTPGICHSCPEYKKMDPHFLEVATIALKKYFFHVKNELIKNSTNGGFIFK